MLENEFDATKILNITAFKDLLSNFDGQWLVGYRNKFHIFLVAKKKFHIFLKLILVPVLAYMTREITHQTTGHCYALISWWVYFNVFL